MITWMIEGIVIVPDDWWSIDTIIICNDCNRTIERKVWEFCVFRKKEQPSGK